MKIAFLLVPVFASSLPNQFFLLCEIGLCCAGKNLMIHLNDIIIFFYYFDRCRIISELLTTQNVHAKKKMPKIERMGQVLYVYQNSNLHLLFRIFIGDYSWKRKSKMHYFAIFKLFLLGRQLRPKTKSIMYGRNFFHLTSFSQS